MAVSVEINEQWRSKKRELVCGACGYGIVVIAEPPACPMCRASAWEPIQRGPSPSRGSRQLNQLVG
ncbi:MAG: hypothetical protein ABSC51_10325 [Gaiellaceae bacterium]|jgi:hypothetical protein